MVTIGTCTQYKPPSISDAQPMNLWARIRTRAQEPMLAPPKVPPEPLEDDEPIVQRQLFD